MPPKKGSDKKEAAPSKRVSRSAAKAAAAPAAAAAAAAKAKAGAAKAPRLEPASSDGKARLDQAVRDWSKLTKAELRAKCDEFEVKYTSSDSKLALAGKLVYDDHFPPAAAASSAAVKGRKPENGSGSGSKVRGKPVANSASDAEVEEVVDEVAQLLAAPSAPASTTAKRKSTVTNTAAAKKQKTEAKAGVPFDPDSNDDSAEVAPHLSRTTPSLTNPATPAPSTRSTASATLAAALPTNPLTSATRLNRQVYDALMRSNMSEDDKFVAIQCMTGAAPPPPASSSSASAAAAPASSSAEPVVTATLNSLAEHYPGLRALLPFYPAKHVKAALDGQYCDLQHFLLPAAPSFKPYAGTGRVVRIVTPAHISSFASVFAPDTSDGLSGVALASLPLQIRSGAGTSTASLAITTTNAQARKLLGLDDWLEAWRAYTCIVNCLPHVKSKMDDSYQLHLHSMVIATRDFGFALAYEFDVQLRRKYIGFSNPLAWDDPALYSKLVANHSLSLVQLSVAQAHLQAATAAGKARSQALADATRSHRKETTEEMQARLSKEVCYNFNRTTGCTQPQGQCWRRHVCFHCEKEGHTLSDCTDPAKPASLPTPSSSSSSSADGSSGRGRGGGGSRGGGGRPRGRGSARRN
jgi:hypothetical protein